MNVTFDSIIAFVLFLIITINMFYRVVFREHGKHFDGFIIFGYFFTVAALIIIYCNLGGTLALGLFGLVFSLHEFIMNKRISNEIIAVFDDRFINIVFVASILLVLPHVLAPNIKIIRYSCL